MQGRSEAAADKLIGRKQLAMKVAWKEQDADDQTPDHVTQHKLQEAEVRGERDAGNRDDGQRTGLCRNDGEGDGPPRNRLPAEKVGAQRFVLRPEAQTEECDANKIGGHDGYIERVQASHLRVSVRARYDHWLWRFIWEWMPVGHAPVWLSVRMAGSWPVRKVRV